MELLQDLDRATRRRFQTGRICLDFTHTGGEGDFAQWELLHQPAETARFLSIILGTNPPLVRSPLIPHLNEIGDRSLLEGTASQACSSLARDAIDLFSSPLHTRIRICEADDCRLLFVDASRPGRRRWCSMNWCGDRQKKRAAGRRVP